MTILQLVTCRQYRGAEVFAAQLSKELVESGHRIIFAGLYSPPADNPLVVAGAENLDLSHHSARFIPHLSILKEISQVIKKEKVTIVQANASDNLKYAVLSRIFFGWNVPIVYRNASIGSLWIKTKMHERIVKYLLEKTDAIACVSRESLADLADNLLVNKEKLRFIPNATPIDSNLDHKESRVYLESCIGERLTGHVILHIGAFTSEKNHAGLIRIFKKITEALNDDAVLVLIGDGPLKADMVEFVGKLGLEKRVVFMGYRPDVERIMPAASLFLLPSQIEGIPAVLLEAGACGVVSVSYDVGSVRSCYPDNLSSSLLVDKNEEDTMVLKSVDLLLGNKERREIGRALIEFVSKNYSLKKVSLQFRQLYEELV